MNLIESYDNFIRSYDDKIGDFEDIAQKWTTPQSNILKREFGSRAIYLTSAILKPIPAAINIILGIGAAATSLITAGKFPKTVKFASSKLIEGSILISTIHENFLKTVNPRANTSLWYDVFHKANSMERAFIKYRETMGNIASDLVKAAISHKKSDSFFHRQITSRLTYALSGLSISIDIIGNTIIGAIAAPLSLITLGTNPSLNALASETLKAPIQLICMLFYTTIKSINPSAKIS